MSAKVTWNVDVGVAWIALYIGSFSSLWRVLQARSSECSYFVQTLQTVTVWPSHPAPGCNGSDTVFYDIVLLFCLTWFLQMEGCQPSVLDSNVESIYSTKSTVELSAAIRDDCVCYTMYQDPISDNDSDNFWGVNALSVGNVVYHFG